MVVERRALVDAVGNRARTEVVLEDFGLTVRAVEDHGLGPRSPGRTDPVAQVGDHRIGLLAVGVGLQDADLLALVALREAVLLHALRVADDHRIGRVDDRTRRAVVLLQLEDHRLGVVLAEREDVLDLRAAERVDRLRVVAHDADLAVVLREAADDDVLRVVGVLILVDEDVAELLLIAGQHLGRVAQQDVGLQQQVVEVHSAVALAALAVDVVDVAELGDLRLPVLGGEGRIGEVGAGGHEAVFREGDARGQRIGLIAVVRKVQLADDGFQQVLAVGGFVDGERLRKADRLGVLAQDAREDRVEGSHADVAAAVSRHHLRDARAHLLGGLVGEGERQDVVGRHALLDHVGDARCEHARLARAGAGDDERRGVVVDHGGVLRRVESLQDFRFVGFHAFHAGKGTNNSNYGIRIAELFSGAPMRAGAGRPATTGRAGSPAASPAWREHPSRSRSASRRRP